MGLIVLGDAGPLPQSSSLDYLIIPYEEADADAAALQSARSAGYQKNRPDVSWHVYIIFELINVIII